MSEFISMYNLEDLKKHKTCYKNLENPSRNRFGSNELLSKFLKK